VKRGGRLLVIACAVATVAAAGQPPGSGDVAAMLALIGEQVQRYYARAQSIVCIETVRLQQVGADLLADSSRPRRLVYELRVAWEPPSGSEGPPKASVLRQLVKIDGRSPRPKDEPGCMDPKPVSPEPLAMLLPDEQDEYAFKWAGTRRMDGRRVVMIDYRSIVKAPEQITWRDDCVSIELPGRSRGRVWADAATGDVLRLDEHLIGMFEFSVPREHRKPGVAASMLIERADTSIRYKAVAFREPDETVLLPASIDTLTIIRNSGAPRVRKTQTFSEYRRFMTEGRVVQ
jgi:hypothetical protein